MRAAAPELVVTNFNRNFTGVSATAAAVTRQLARQFDLRLCGHPLPGLDAPIGKVAALAASSGRPDGRPFGIWHVRRNSEMQFALFARDILRKPIRIVFTSAAQRLHSAWPRLLISRMDAVIATTDAAASHVPHVRAVVPHGVDTEMFQPAPDRAAAWAESGFPGARGIACVGRLRPEKGTDLFVRAMIDALPRFPDTTAVLFGLAQAQDRAFVDGLRKDIADAGLADRFVFTGEIAPDRFAKLLPAFSLLVAPPRYEGYGMTVLEAMAAGVPFVASDTGIFKVAAGDCDVGEVVPVDDWQALSGAVERSIANPQRIATAATAARSRAVDRFSVAREAAGIAEVYRDLWAGKTA